LVGPWAHEYPHFAKPGPQIGFLQECLRWWDQWLKGEDTGIMREPVLRVWLEESLPPKTHLEERPGRWVAEEAWPSPRITPRGWNLASWRLVEGAVAQEALSIRSPETVGLAGGSLCPHGVGHDLPADQRVEAGGSLIFDSAPLSGDLEILGAGLAELEVSADKPVAKLACTLSEVHPDGSVERVSYRLLNLAHRDSYEHPAPLERGKRYRVKVQLKDAGHRFAAGNRIRLAISTAYWQVAWPSPEPATVTVYTGFSRLTLPIRPLRSEDAALTPFPEPEGAPRLKRRFLEAPFERRVITTDRATGEVTYEWSESDGVYRIEDIDLTVGIRRTRRVSIHPDKPNSARSEMHWHRAYSRGDWRTSAESATVLTSDRDHFRLVASMDAFDGETRVFSGNWDERVSRDLN
jgi:uncharacterized protein